MNIGIVVFAFNRPALLNDSLSSLLKTHNINEYPVMVFVDGPRNSRDSVLIEETIKVIKSHDMANLVLKVSPVNIGLANSVVRGVTEAFNTYDALIVLEDDLVYSPNFIDYMVKSLEKYKSEGKVGSISGYSFEVGKKNNADNYFHPRPSSWGWATWEDRWNKICWNSKEYDTSLMNMCRFSKNGQDLPRMLKDTISGVRSSWAICWAYKHFDFDWVCSYPFTSMVDNDGFGDDATNCKGSNQFKSSFMNSFYDKWVFEDTVVVDQRIKRKFNSYNSNYTKIKGRIKNLLGFLHKYGWKY